MPMLLRRSTLRLSRSAEKLVETAPASGASSVWMLRAPMLYAPGAAGEPAAAQHRHRLALAQPDLPAEEQQRHVARAVAGLHAAEVEDALALDEEVALLGEEQAEAGQVDLLQVLFHLGEVGPHGGVEDQAAGQPVLEVEAGVGVEIVVESPAARALVGRRRAAYGFSSRFFDPAGVSSPTTVAAEAIRLTPPVPSAAGTSERYENSFFHFTSRRRLMPQVCGPLPR